MGRAGPESAKKIGSRSRFSAGIALLALILLPAAADAAVQTAGNAFYRVHVEDAGATLGRYTATTGPSHAQGPGVNVLFGSGVPGTTFDSVRSFTTGTTYTQGAGGSGLGAFGAVTPLGSTGLRTTYTLPGSSGDPDAMTIEQDFIVVGSTCEDSRIVRETRITNRNLETPLSVGIRYLWDTQIGDDDGPTFQQLGPDGPVLVNEASFVPPGFQTYRIVDNDSNPTPPTFAVLGTANGPTTISPQPTPPTALKYVSWGAAASTTFDYNTSGQNVANGADSAVIYWWGHNPGSAIDIPPGATRTVNSQMLATPSGTCAPLPPPPPATPATPATPLEPIEGVQVVADPQGTVRARCPGEGGFRGLTATEEIAIGCTFDTTKGRVTLTSSYNGTPETVTFYDGRFKLKQKEGAKPFLIADLKGKLGCPRRSSKAKAGDVGELGAKRKRGKRRLWGDGKGHFTTRGDGGAASGRGTKWLTADRCDRETRFRVRRGKVVIDDFDIPGRRNLVLRRAGKSYVTGN